jgi:transketolase
MGCAEMGAVLFAEVLKHYPQDPQWLNRDRFVLSAGHGSMFLYSLLHLSGYDVSLEDLKNFRQFGSKTPGHPEYGYLDGVETTTGPLGAGFSNAVGMAVAEEMLAARFNTEHHKIFDHYTYSLAGDGCMMEGVTSEAASLAGHLELDKLIVFYDSNKITIEGSTDLAFSEDVVERFKAYKWHTQAVDAYDMEGLKAAVEMAKAESSRPSLIMINSIIGKGAFSMEGFHETHGAPLGEDEIRNTRKKLGIPESEDFFIQEGAKEYFGDKMTGWKKGYEDWTAVYESWGKENPGLREELESYLNGKKSYHDVINLPEFKVGDKVATRAASGKVLQAVADGVGNLVGGSADLAPSNKTAMSGKGDFNAYERTGRNLHFGVREHAMGGVTNGIALHGGLRPFCATFLVFADYMRPAVRLAALMKLPVTYVFTHDSIYVGEDGPTHQPVEHLASLRVIPGLTVLRPADAEEAGIAWLMAMERKDGPTALALTRQGLEVFEKADPDWKHSAAKGAYIARDTDGDPDVVVVATGSEVTLALAAAEKVTGKKVRVVSMLCREEFLKQDESFRTSLLPESARIVVAEAGVKFGWECIASSPADILSIEKFGESGPAAKVAEYFGFTADNLVKLIEG